MIVGQTVEVIKTTSKFFGKKGTIVEIFFYPFDSADYWVEFDDGIKRFGVFELKVVNV